jgi:hypothetical protein
LKYGLRIADEILLKPKSSSKQSAVREYWPMLEAISFKNNFSKTQTRVSAEFSKVGPNTIR